MTTTNERTLTADDVKILSQPFDKSRLGVKVQSFSKDRSKAMLVLYLQHTDVMDQLEKVDPAWTTEVIHEERQGDTVYVRIRLTLKGVSRENVGEGGDPKSAYSDALKRGAMLFGVGRYLYDSPTVWVDYNDGRDKFKQWSVEEYDAAAARSRYRRPEPPKEPSPGKAGPVSASGASTAPLAKAPQASASSASSSGSPTASEPQAGGPEVGKSPPSSKIASASPATAKASPPSSAPAAGEAGPAKSSASSPTPKPSSSPSQGKGEPSSGKTRTREQLNRILMQLYRPYLTAFPDTRFQELIQQRYQVGETRLMTLEQMEDLVAHLEARLRDAGTGPSDGPGNQPSGGGSGPKPIPNNAPEAAQPVPRSAPQAPAKAKAPARPERDSKAPNAGPTEAQRKRLFAIMRTAQWNDEQMRTYMAARFGVESTTELTKSGYDTLVGTIERMDFDSAMQDLKEAEGEDQSRPAVPSGTPEWEANTPSGIYPEDVADGGTQQAMFGT